MRQQRLLTGLFSGLGIFFLILDRPTALSGAGEGLKLSLQTVIPGLFPFFFLTALLSSSLGSCRWMKPLGMLMGVPENCTSLLIPAFLGGYPIGAKTVADCCNSHSIDKETGKRLLFFCSNAGPAFLFGVLPAVLPEKWMILSLWGIHIITAILISLWIPAVREDPGKAPGNALIKPSQAMTSAVRASALVSGWIICFRILIAAADHWVLWRLPQWSQVFAAGLIELTAGCSRLSCIPSVELRFVFAAGFLGFGGLCISMQTASVLGGLPIKPYIIGKLLHGTLSMLLALSVITHTWPVALTLALLSVLVSRKLKNRGRKIPVLGV